MKITEEWLKEKNACQVGIDWFNSYHISDGKKLVKALMIEDKLSWANWLIVRIMSYKQYVSYAVFAAEQVIDIYEKKYPKDKRPRAAIEVAKKCIENPSVENKLAAVNAAYAAYAAYAAADAADAADAANAVNAAAYAVNAAAKIKILNYGLSLIDD